MNRKKSEKSLVARRDFLGRLVRGAGAAAFAGALPGFAEGAARTARPNILFIFVDDMGYADPSCFGNPVVKTPNMDRLAREGIRLTNFYVNSPICSPSRVAVHTGQHPHRWKIHSYIAARKANQERHMADFLDPKAPTVARILKSQGYATAHFGKWHMGGGRDVGEAPTPRAYGFDESLVSFEGLGDRILPPGGLSNASAKLGKGKIRRVEKHEMTGIYVDRAIDFIERHKDGPFYLHLFPNDVHDAHVPAPGEEEKWNEATKNPFERKFFAVLEEMDRQFGRLLDALDEKGLAEKTLVVLTSDNGPTDWPRYYKAKQNPPGFTGPWFGRKWSLYEGGIRMPFIARWKGRIPAGKTNDTTLMCGVDLLPTFCSIAKVEIPASVRPDGVDMSAALLGKPATREKPLFWQYGGEYTNILPGNPEFRSPSLAVRHGDWKFLMNPDGSEAQLFNLIQDPGEKTNLAKKNPKEAQKLKKILRIWAEEMGFEMVEG